jgi:integrase
MALRVALDNEMIVKDPMRALKLPKLPKPQIESMSESDIGKLLEVAKDYNIYETIVTGFCTGLRTGEMLALDWKDVILRTNQIPIYKTLVRVKDESGKEVLKVQFMPKTDCGFRTVPSSKEIVKLLNALKKRLAKGFNDNGIVFCSIKGTRIHPRNINRDLERPMQKSRCRRISANVTWHTFATTAIELGAEAKTVSEILGHRRIVTTFNIYYIRLQRRQKK